MCVTPTATENTNTIKWSSIILTYSVQNFTVKCAMGRKRKGSTEGERKGCVWVMSTHFKWMDKLVTAAEKHTPFIEAITSTYVPST